jgi:hypothetical protein
MGDMLFNAGSLLLIGLIAIYQIYGGFRKKDAWSRTVGIRSGVASAVLSGLAFGSILAQAFDASLAVLLAGAAVFGAAAGAFGGLPFGVRAAVNGGLAGMIAAMPGTVLGGLFFGSGKVVLVTALLYIVCVFLLQRAADRFAGGHGNKAAKRSVQAPRTGKASFRSSYILGACAVVCFAGIVLLQDRLHLGAIGQPLAQQAVMDDANDLQVATIDVTGAGFAPKVTEFQSNAMIKVIFNVKASAGNGVTIVSKDLNFSADVKPGQNIFLLNNPQPGDYAIEVGSRGYAGTFTVKAAAGS